MADVPRTREDVRALAAEVARTPHPALDAETIDRVIELADDVRERLAGEADREAIRDLLAFWDGYVRGGVEDVVDDVDEFEETHTLRERFERGNAADLFGLDVYQAIMKLEETYDETADEVGERAADWAGRVASLTAEFAAHLEGHKH